ncbi:MAG: ACT domain-containing protein [Chloroflexota bacterium]
MDPIKQALQDATLYVDEDSYRLVKLHPSAITAAAGVIAEVGEPFGVLIADKDEVSLVLPDEAIADFANRLVDLEMGDTYKLLTIEAVLPPDLIGFMAVVSRALADAEVGVFPYAAYSRDHILVPAHQVTAAIEAFDKLKARYQDT